MTHALSTLQHREPDTPYSGGMNPLKGKVLRIFGVVIRPANWLIFIAGIIIVCLAPWLWSQGEGLIESLILFVTGLTLLVQGYGEVKDDEDVEPR